MKKITNFLQSGSKNYPDEENFYKMITLFTNQKNFYGIFASYFNIKKVYSLSKVFVFLFLTKRIIGCFNRYIEDIKISKKYRMRAIGKIILKNLINKSKKESFFKLVLECRNKAKDFIKYGVLHLHC